MALMNVAYQLAGWGRHVLIVDMDLEAPGLSRTDEFSPSSKDVIDLLSDAMSVLDGEQATKELAKQLPPLSIYIRSVIDANLVPLAPKLGQLGRLDLIGVDVNRDHLGRLARLGLKDLSHDRLIELSRLLHHCLKAQRFPHRPFWLEEFEPSEECAYDYVLVDSRTGITEIGGLCVGPLSDRLVVVTGLNDQNIKGTREVLEEVGVLPEPRSAASPPWEEADRPELNPSLGPKPTIVVASPVPQETTITAERLKKVKATLGIEPLALSYHLLQALTETIFVREHPKLQLSLEYRELAARAMSLVRDDASTLTLEARSFIGGRAVDLALAATLRLAPCDPGVGSAFLGALTGTSDARNSELPEMRQAYALLSQQPGLESYALIHWGIRLVILAGQSNGEEGHAFFDSAYKKFERASGLQPDSFACWYNWGRAQLVQGQRRSGEAARGLYEDAQRKLTKAIQLASPLGERHLSETELAAALDASAKVSRLLGLREDALDKSLKAEKLKPGSSAFNLACIHAADGIQARMMHWLRKAVPRPSRAQMSRVSVFDPYLDDPELQAFLATLPEN